MASVQTGPATRGLQRLAIPAVCLLIAFLGYTSQWLFHAAAEDLRPGPLTGRQSLFFNALLLCLWWTYYKACSVDPGRYPSLPSPSPSHNDKTGSTSPQKSQDGSSKPTLPSTTAATAAAATTTSSTPRYCKKCRAPKPPRAHHCRHCARCIPKMDHHCPWTGNCVSLQTFPHFLRFLLFANASLWTLASHLCARFAGLWADRHLPAYLGPTLPQLVLLTVLGLVCGAVCLALGIMLFTTARAWVLNTTMIEGWEVERHDAVLERYHGSSSSSSSMSSYWDEQPDDSTGGGDGGGAGYLDRIEFPYDIGFFANMAQAMGTSNFLLWLLPFAGGPSVSADGTGCGWDWEENGFNDREGMWPPPDPEKLRRARAGGWPGARASYRGEGGGDYDYDASTPEETKAAFRARQARDLRRWETGRDYQQQTTTTRSGIIAELEEDEYFEEGHQQTEDYNEEGMDGEPGWTNADGDRLRDYGVDEDAEEDEVVKPSGFVDTIVAQEDEDVPLAELIRRRKVLEKDGER